MANLRSWGESCAEMRGLGGRRLWREAHNSKEGKEENSPFNATVSVGCVFGVEGARLEVLGDFAGSGEEVKVVTKRGGDNGFDRQNLSLCCCRIEILSWFLRVLSANL